MWDIIQEPIYVLMPQYQEKSLYMPHVRGQGLALWLNFPSEVLILSLSPLASQQ